MSLCAATLMVLLCACTSEPYEAAAPPGRDLSQSSANAISADEALKRLDNFLYGDQLESTVHVHCDFGWGGKNNGYLKMITYDAPITK